MAYVRGQEQFVHKQFVNFVKTGMLDTLGWDGTELSDDALPWGAQNDLIWVETTPEVKLAFVKPNTIAISEGVMPDDGELELGGGLVAALHTYFIDIYAESHQLAKVLGADVRSLLNGRAGPNPYQQLLDWSKTPTVPLLGHVIHMQDVELSWPGTGDASQIAWAVVKVTVVHEYTP